MTDDDALRPVIGRKERWQIALIAAFSLVIVLLRQASLSRRTVADRPEIPLLVGCVAAFVLGLTSRIPVLHVGAAALAGFPLWAIADLLCGGEGHGLLPFEFFFYGCYIGLGVGCAAIGRGLRRASQP